MFEVIPALHPGGNRGVEGLAIELNADLILIDERKAYRQAVALKLNAIGTIRLLERAAAEGLLDLQDAFERVKQTDFWISPRISCSTNGCDFFNKTNGPMTHKGFSKPIPALTAKRTAQRPAAPELRSQGAAITVTQLTKQIEKAIKTGVPATVAVRGELSNFKSQRAASGHLYFTLKDTAACIDCVMWADAAARLKFKLADGLEVIATGRVGVYADRGKYQLYVSTLSPLGKGALELAFQQMRAKLEAEGLFAAERKKPLPPYPLRISSGDQFRHRGPSRTF